MTAPFLTLEIRTATKADCSLIQQWLAHNHLPNEDIPQIIHCLYLAMYYDVVVGIGGIERYGEDGLLRSLVIAEPFRQQGYGQLLCRQLLQRAKREGIQALYLLTETADRFFAKLGFESINRQSVPAAIQGTTEFSRLCPDSAICMRRNLCQ